MSAALHLAGPDDAARLLPLVAAFHAECGQERDDAQRAAALQPLLEGSPHGAVYLIGPVRAPIGYLVVTFGWSLHYGGMEGFVDELFVRRGVRGRGIASEALGKLTAGLRGAGVTALHLLADRDSAALQRLFARAHFKARPDLMPMTRRF